MDDNTVQKSKWCGIVAIYVANLNTEHMWGNVDAIAKSVGQVVQASETALSDSMFHV